MSAEGTNSPATHTAPTGSSGLDAQLDALLAEMTVPDQAAAAPPVDAARAAEETVATIEQQVESLVDQFVQASEPAAEATPAPAKEEAAAPATHLETVPASIEALDEQLARLTQGMGTKPAEAKAPAPAPASAATPAPAAPAPAVQQAPTPAPAAAAPEKKDPPPAPVAADSEPAKPAAAPAPVVVKTREPSGLVRALSRPLAGKPRLVRDTVGWLGVNSVFLAGVVWAYHVWFQRPEAIVADHSPAGLVVAGHEHEAHGTHAEATGEGHGEGKPEASKPGETEHADAHGAAAPDESPITGALPLIKKKPTYALSDVMAAKLAGKKPGEKDAKGEGGGHGEAKKPPSHGGH